MITLQNLQVARKGGWKPGQSGNPAGSAPRRAGDVDIAALARTYSVDALHTLVKCLRDDRFKLQAAIAILDRGYGKPPVSVHAESQSTVLHLVAARELGDKLLEHLTSPTDDACIDASAEASTSTDGDGNDIPLE